MKAIKFQCCTGSDVILYMYDTHIVNITLISLLKESLALLLKCSGLYNIIHGEEKYFVIIMLSV